MKIETTTTAHANPRAEAQINRQSGNWIFCFPSLAAKPVPGITPPVFGFRPSGLLRISTFGLRVYPALPPPFLRLLPIHLHPSLSMHSTPRSPISSPVFCSFLQFFACTPGRAHRPCPPNAKHPPGKHRKPSKNAQIGDPRDLHTFTSGFRTSFSKHENSISTSE